MYCCCSISFNVTRVLFRSHADASSPLGNLPPVTFTPVRYSLSILSLRRVLHLALLELKKALCIASREDWDLPAANSTLLTIYGFKLSTDLHWHHYSRSWASYSLESNEDRECAHEKKAILWAAAKGESQTMAFLLTQTPSDLSFRNCYGQRALSLAAEHGHRDIMQLILTRAHVDVNDRDIDGQTPLAWAAFHGHFGLVEMLLDRDDLDANTKDVDGNTPLA